MQAYLSFFFCNKPTSKKAATRTTAKNPQRGRKGDESSTTYGIREGGEKREKKKVGMQSNETLAAAQLAM